MIMATAQQTAPMKHNDGFVAGNCVRFKRQEMCAATRVPRTGSPQRETPRAQHHSIINYDSQQKFTDRASTLRALPRLISTMLLMKQRFGV